MPLKASFFVVKKLRGRMKRNGVEQKCSFKKGDKRNGKV